MKRIKNTSHKCVSFNNNNGFKLIPKPQIKQSEVQNSHKKNLTIYQAVGTGFTSRERTTGCLYYIFNTAADDASADQCLVGVLLCSQFRFDSKIDVAFAVTNILFLLIKLFWREKYEPGSKFKCKIVIC